MDENVIQEDDEISLLDLFAVLIKNRKMIIWGTVIAGVLAALWLFVAPKVFPSSKNSKLTVNYSIGVNDFPANIKRIIVFTDKENTVDSVLTFAEKDFVKENIIADINKKYPVLGGNSVSNVYEYNSFIQSAINSGKISAKVSPLNNSVDLQLKISEDNVSYVENFVKALVENTESDLQNYFFPKLAFFTTDISGENNNSESSVINNEIEQYKRNFSSFLVIPENPFILSDASGGNTKKFIIIIFAVFFVLVFCAFLKNAVENIKKDPQASSLIKDAWKNGK